VKGTDQGFVEVSSRFRRGFVGVSSRFRRGCVLSSPTHVFSRASAVPHEKGYTQDNAGPTSFSIRNIIKHGPSGWLPYRRLERYMRCRRPAAPGHRTR
jgi:hypothetical protein